MLRGASVPPASSLMTHFPVIHLRGSNNEAQVSLFCQRRSPAPPPCLSHPTPPSTHSPAWVLTRHALSPPTPTLRHNTLKIIGFCSVSPLFLPEFKRLACIFFFHREWDERKKFSKAKEKEETGSPHILIFSDSNFLRPSFARYVKTGMVKFTSKSYRTLCFNLFVTCPAQYWSWRKHLINGAHIMTVGCMF